MDKKLTAAICMGIVSMGTAAKTIYKASGGNDWGCKIGSGIIGCLIGGTVANTALGIMNTIEESIKTEEVEEEPVEEAEEA